MAAIQERSFCAEYSRTAGEDMAGSVKPVDLWLLIEYRARWEHDAIAVFSESVQERLAALRTKIPKMRLALIKQNQRDAGPLNLFWAFSREQAPSLFRSEFAAYEDLAFDPDHPGRELTEKLFAVCTHGTHDLCCARFGNNIYSELETHSPSAWQISHVGGCRFAPNVVCLPHGIVYGRVDKPEVSAVVSSYQQNQILPANLRGRSCYSRPVQAAERFLRLSQNLTALDDLAFIGATETQPRHWSVAFRLPHAAEHQVSLTLEDTQVSTYKSCSATELSPREKFTLLNP